MERERRSSQRIDAMIPVISLVLTTLVIGLTVGLSHSNSLKRTPIDFEVKPFTIKQNDTVLRDNSTKTVNTELCTYLKTYALTPTIRASVCNHRFEGIKLDIRYFIDGRATIKGITLSLGAFRSLNALWPVIVRSMLGL